MPEPRRPLTLADLEEVGIPKALVVELSEIPGSPAVLELCGAMMDSIIHTNEKRLIKSLGRLDQDVDIRAITLYQGRISLARTLKLAFENVLDTLNPIESAESASTQEKA